MEEIEIPEYFICPISLQIMKDPVTVVTGITFDRQSIEQWLFKTKVDDTMLTCPVTNQPLPRDHNNNNIDSMVTPNHTLRRLIQQWCTQNLDSSTPTPSKSHSTLNKICVLKLVRDLGVSHLQGKVLKKMEALVTENEGNKRFMAEAGVPKAMVLFITTCFNRAETNNGLVKALSILRHVWSFVHDDEIKLLVNGNIDFVESLLWVLGFDHHKMDGHLLARTEAIMVLKKTIQVLNSSHQLELLKPEFFKNIIMVLEEKTIFSQQAVKSALHVLIESCYSGRNRTKIVESGAVFHLIELELRKPEKNMTELIFNLLENLCGCADGRAQLLKHGGGIAMVSKRILRVSPATDDRAVNILSMIAKFSGTHEVALEMLLVGAVSKLCMVMQADCEAYLKKKVRRILRLHSNVWNNSPCIAVYLLTRPR